MIRILALIFTAFLLSCSSGPTLTHSIEGLGCNWERDGETGTGEQPGTCWWADDPDVLVTPAEVIDPCEVESSARELWGPGVRVAIWTKRVELGVPRRVRVAMVGTEGECS